MDTDSVNLPLPRDLYQELQRLAERAGVEPADLLRRVLEETADRAPRSAHEAGRRFCGVLEDAPPDVSADLGRYLEGYGR